MRMKEELRGNAAALLDAWWETPHHPLRSRVPFQTYRARDFLLCVWLIHAQPQCRTAWKIKDEPVFFLVLPIFAGSLKN